MLCARNLKIGYGENIIINDLSLDIHDGQLVSIIGPNGCGKSTLLKTLSRIIKPLSGDIFLDSVNIKGIKNKLISQKICLLSQHNNSPSDLTVEELVSFGRIPHKKWYEPKTTKDKEIVHWAIENTGLKKYTNTPIGSLSGGERQRAHVAQALCQKPNILLLDEPTTYLDISYQLELMELVRDINKNLNITIVMVLHELNQAIKYSDRLIIMKKGAIFSDGTPDEIVNTNIIKEVYNIECTIDKDPTCNKPRIYPLRTINIA